MSLVPLECPCSCIVLVTEINNRRHLQGQNAVSMWQTLWLQHRLIFVFTKMYFKIISKLMEKIVSGTRKWLRGTHNAFSGAHSRNTWHWKHHVLHWQWQGGWMNSWVLTQAQLCMAWDSLITTIYTDTAGLRLLQLQYSAEKFSCWSILTVCRDGLSLGKNAVAGKSCFAESTVEFSWLPECRAFCT